MATWQSELCLFQTLGVRHGTPHFPFELVAGCRFFLNGLARLFLRAGDLPHVPSAFLAGRFLNLTTHEIRSVLVVSIPHVRLDRTASLDCRSSLLNLAGNREFLVLDLSRVLYADAFGVDLLLDTVRLCPGKVCFGGVHPSLENLITMTLGGRIIATYRTVDQAVECCEKIKESRPFVEPSQD
ncbi:MAG: hypothetical protein U1D30_14950 [Planctomycetota bacterium]